jgi:hypothetical protein
MDIHHRHVRRNVKQTLDTLIMTLIAAGLTDISHGGSNINRITDESTETSATSAARVSPLSTRQIEV